MRFSRVAVGLLALAAGLQVTPEAMAEEEVQVLPGSATRIERSPPSEDATFYLRIATTESECDDLTYPFNEDPGLCTPVIEPGRGNVRLAAQVRGGARGGALALPFRVDENGVAVDPHQYIKVSHGVDDVRNGEVSQGVERRVELIPHGEVSGDQLFVLLIDRSPSMNATDGGRLTRMERTQRALLDPGVIGNFFKGRNNRVLLLTFSNDVVPLGNRGSYELISDRGRYEELVSQLSTGGSQTNLYHSIGHVVDNVLEAREVQSFTSSGTGEYAQVTVVVLTDGFDWSNSQDTCGSNARQLRSLLGKLNRLQDQPNPPTIYTVGLGRKALSGFPWIPEGDDPVRYRDEVRALLNTPPTPEALCGESVNALIDPPSGVGLEEAGIDNASLEWIAHVGGGEAYVRRGPRQLAEAFKGAAARRFEWFEVRYHTDPTYFNQSFETELRMQAFVDARAKLRVHPPGWFSTPERHDVGDDWIGEVSPVRATFAFAVPVLGAMLSMLFLGSATYNLRRWLTRLRPRG